MIFKNTFKLLFTNFSLTYKVLIYKLIILLLALGVAGTIGAPFLMYLGEIDFFNFVLGNITTMFENINLGNVFVCFKDIFLKIVEIFSLIDVKLLINVIISFVVFISIFGLLGSASELAVIDCLNANMSSKTKLSFFKSMISKYFNSLLLNIVKFLTKIPYYICLFFIFYYGFVFFDTFTGFAKVLIPTGMFLAFVLLTSFQLSFTAGFAPSIIVHDEGVFNAFKTGIHSIKKKYFKVLSTSLMIVFLLTVSNLLIAVFSFFAGLIITLPVTYLIINLFKIISFYESNGMRYYVGDLIRTPLKKEEQDKINKLKHII